MHVVLYGTTRKDNEESTWWEVCVCGGGGSRKENHTQERHKKLRNICSYQQNNTFIHNRQGIIITRPVYSTGMLEK